MTGGWPLALQLKNQFPLCIDQTMVLHHTYLMYFCSLTTVQVEKRLNKLNITDELISRDREFPEYMNDNVRPHIDGTDMNKLMLYYRLIEPCTSLSSETVTPETHRKLLAKLMPVAPGMKKMKFLLKNWFSKYMYLYLGSLWPSVGQYHIIWSLELGIKNVVMLGSVMPIYGHAQHYVCFAETDPWLCYLLGTIGIQNGVSTQMTSLQ